MRVYFFLLLLINSLVFIPASGQDTVVVKQLLEQGNASMAENPDKALALFQKSLAISRKLKYDAGIGVALSKLAGLKSVSDLQASINLFTEARLYLVRSGNVLLEGSVLYTLAEFHERIGNLDSSIYYCMEAVYLNEKQQSHNEPVWLYAMISSLYLHIEEYNKSLLYAKKTIAGGDHPSYKALGYIAMSKAFKAMKEEDSALQYATLPLSKEEDLEPFFLCQVYNNLAEMYLLNHQTDSALYYINKVETLYKSQRVGLRDKLVTYLLATDVHLEKKELDKARFYLDKSISFIQTKAYTVHIPDLNERLSKMYFELGMYKEAFIYNDSAALNRSLLSKAKNRFVISDLETKYQSTLKEKQLSDKQLQLQRSKQHTFLSIFIAVLALLIASGIYLYYKYKRRLFGQQLQTIQQEKEIQLLQALMQGEEKERSRIAKDLHDGVAGMLAAAKMQLSSLSLKQADVADTKEYQQAVKLLDDSTQEVRMTSHNLMPEVLIQHGLHEALRRYCTNISTGNLLSVRYESLGEVGRYIDTFELSIYRIVQELLNNVVKHSKATEAVVQLSVQEDILRVMIEDNGVGFKEGLNKGGMGLSSLAARVKAMKGYFELDAQPNSGVTAFIEFSVAGLEEKSNKNTIKLKQLI